MSVDSNYEHITSTANTTVKRLRSLDRKQGRRKEGLFLVEGERLIREARDHDWLPEVVVLHKESLEQKRIVSLLDDLNSRETRILSASDKVMSAISRKDNPQTMVAAYCLRELPIDVMPVVKHGRYVALYQIRDPGNLGTIIRTCDAAGVDGILLLDGCCDPFSVECVRATMGSLFAVPLAELSFDAFERWQRGLNGYVVGASVNGKARHDQMDYGKTSILMMGNEQSGIPGPIEQKLDDLVRLPMCGSADSLNLAQATGVMVYEIWRQRGFDGAAS